MIILYPAVFLQSTNCFYSMRIVFGWNHFCIKAYAPHELGLPINNEHDYKIEVRQRYFHLFWIPFFGIGKKWALRKDSGLYELPLEFESFLKSQRLKLKTPWYTYAGPLLILMGFIIWNISDSIQAANRLRGAKIYFNNEIKKLEGRYQASAKADYYTLKPLKGNDKYILLQVTEVRPKEIVFRKIVTGLSEYELSPRKIESLFSMAPPDDTIAISKESLNKAIKREYETQNNGTDLFGDGSEYIVKDIFKLNGPLLIDRGTGSFGGTARVIYFEIMNYGWPASLISIENKTGNIRWKNQLPLEVATSRSDYDAAGRIALSGENYDTNSAYEFEIVMKDSLAKEHRYNIKGNNMDKSITQLY